MSAVCGRGSARGRILYPGSVAGAQPEPGPCAVVVVGEGGSAALKRASVARYLVGGHPARTVGLGRRGPAG